MPPGQTRSPSGDRGVPWASPRCRRTSAGEVGTPGPFRGGPALRVIAGAERDRPPPPRAVPPCRKTPRVHTGTPARSRCRSHSRCKAIPGAAWFPGADSSRCKSDPPPVPTHSRCRPVSRCRLIPLQTRPGADRHRQPPLGPGGHKQLTPSGLKRGSSRYFPAPGPGPDGAAQPQASPSPVRRRRPARLHRPGAPSGPGAPGEPGEPGVPGVSGHRPRTMICGRKARPAAEQPRSPSDGSGGPRRPGRALKKMGESRGRSRPGGIRGTRRDGQGGTGKKLRGEPCQRGSRERSPWLGVFPRWMATPMAGMGSPMAGRGPQDSHGPRAGNCPHGRDGSPRPGGSPRQMRSPTAGKGARGWEGSPR